MKRSASLKGLGILGEGPVLPMEKAAAAANSLGKSTARPDLIPSETEGPFPLTNN